MPATFNFRKIMLSVIPFSFIHFVKKKMSVSYFFFGKSLKNKGTYLVNDTTAEFTLYGMEEELGAEVAGGFRSCYKTYLAHHGLLRKYVLQVENCIIEPEYGWGICEADNRLVFDSVSNNSWIETYHPSYIKYRKNKDKAISYPDLISINLIPGGENNYWHFLHDLLGQVALAKKVLPGNIPFLISKTLAEKPFFKSALLQSSYLSQCTWVIRDDKYYRADMAYFLQTMPNSNEQFLAVREILQVNDSDKNKERKIFLTRSKKRIRFVSNKTEIEDLARRYHYEIVDADDLTLQQQITLFGETKYLIGIHGAGLTNVLYRKNASLHLLELLPQDYLQPHYFWISKGMGHSYSCLVGSRIKYDTSFYIDPEKFEKKIKQMLETGTDNYPAKSFSTPFANTVTRQFKMNFISRYVPYKIIRAILKNCNLNRILFSYAAISEADYVMEDTNYSFRYYGMEKELGHKVMSGFIIQAMSYTKPYKLQREYIINGGCCYIEPQYGWGIKYGTNRLIKDSVIYNRHLENYHPSFLRYKLLKKSKARYFPKLVSVRMIAGAEKNYWHFLSDMLGVLVLIDKYHFPKDIPLVISKKLADQKFFQEVIAYSPDLQNRNWIIQDKEYILADEVFFCQKMPNQKDQFTGLLELLGIPDADKNKNRKVYVSRSPARIRFIKNNKEIEKIAAKYGFEIIDCDNLSFSDQVALFSECSHVIGIHGAGLTNIVWRKNAPLTLLELFPGNYIHPGYFWLAKSFDKNYMALTGSGILPDTSFYIEPAKFEEKITEMLTAGL